MHEHLLHWEEAVIGVAHLCEQKAGEHSKDDLQTPVIRCNPPPNTSLSQHKVEQTPQFSLPTGSTHQSSGVPYSSSCCFWQAPSLLVRAKTTSGDSRRGLAQPWMNFPCVLADILYPIFLWSRQSTGQLHLTTGILCPSPWALPHISTEHLLSL